MIVGALGLPSAVIGPEAAEALAKRLESLGAFARPKRAQQETTKWCVMAVNPTKGPNSPKELVEIDRSPMAPDSENEVLELRGIICPADLYEAKLHSCTWDFGESQSPADLDECPLCAFIKGGGCAEEFMPFKACLEAATAAADKSEDNGGDSPKVDCMPLFAPVVACMDSTPEKRAYYKTFKDDFPHLFAK
mmetsp:Transcript_45551/g.102866  ORF Transcript_45551/g.102866 Transcript_45551/m.102866 type:complete len:192 (-) Transcript_45551:188-763(-)